jgi:hypothetical protein
MGNDAIKKLPRRDYLLIPLVSLLTIVVMLGAIEVISRTVYPNYPEYALDTCALPPAEGAHHKPDCSVKFKITEGPAYVESYNDCGYRSISPCGPKPTGHIRIAMLGSSFALGYGVPYEQSFARETELDLSRACRRPVEIQNLSAGFLQPLQMYGRFNEALALQPDLVVVIINPQDASSDYTSQDIQNRDSPRSVQRKPQPLPAWRKLAEDLKGKFYAIAIAEHFLFLNQSNYISHYLQYGDEADFLRVPYSPVWQRRFANLDILLGGMADRARAKGVPLVFSLGLQRAQAGLMNDPSWPKGVDPYAFGRAFDEIAARHGIINIDPEPDFARTPNASNLFYAVNAHLNAKGNDVYHQALTRGLLSSNLAAFQGCSDQVAFAHQPETK